MASRYLRLECGALAERHEKMRVLVGREHDCSRPLDMGQPGIQQRPCGAGGVHHIAVVQQDQRVNTVVGHRGPQPGSDLAVHAGPVR